MLKILTGGGYTKARLAGIMHEMFVEYKGDLQNTKNVTMYLDGQITYNTITGEIGAIFNTESEFFYLLPNPHPNRIIDIVPGDGWNDSTYQENISG
jgi:hypothetical protein